MQATSTPRVKICCIRSVEEAWTAIRHGASALGLVSKMPSGPGAIPDEDIAAIAAAVPPPVATFLLTSRQDAASIIEQQRRLRTTTVQVCDRLEREAYAELRRELPGVRIVAVVHVTGPASVDEAVGIAGQAVITPENAAEAMAAVGPFALDVCTGVRTNGALDEAKLEALFAALDPYP